MYDSSGLYWMAWEKEMEVQYGAQNCVLEWTFRSAKAYADPFNDVELDAIITDPDGKESRVPAFWAGEDLWRVRYASPKTGRHRYRTVCSDNSNRDLDGLEDEFEIIPYEGSNPLLARGPLRVSEGRRHLEHLDGTPFFWLGDTWWMGLCKRLKWPGDYQELIADRVAKGFSVIQIVAGLYPDMDAFDRRGENEAGFPWDKDFLRINPAYFDMADLRIFRLVESGLLPCIVGCWGYFICWMGAEKMKKHWRHLVARYGALPVVWCLAGEGSMPFYLSETAEDDRRSQKERWTQLAAYLHSVDPFGHPVTIHPSDSARNVVTDASLLDFDMLQTGHGDRRSLPGTMELVTRSYEAQPRLPVINGEVCYEGIGEACRQEVQRMMFWTCMLSGACGHTYGANGIWQVNSHEKLYGPSPHGMAWGNTPWQEACQLPGSAQVALGKKLLERHQWWRFEPHPEWVEPHWTQADCLKPHAAGIPGEVRVIYLPLCEHDFRVTGIEPDVAYRALLFNPADGAERDLGPVSTDEAGCWRLPMRRLPIYQDWVIVLDTQT